MQTDPSAMDGFLNPEGQAKAPPALAAALRGLQILQLTLAVELGAGLLGGMARALVSSEGRAHGGLAMLGMTLTVVQLVFLGTAIAELVALSALTAAPPASRVAELARPALILRGLSFAVYLISWAVPYVLRHYFDSPQGMQHYLYSGYVETVLHLIGTYFVIELLLRLRRFAAPSDPKVAESEGLMRGLALAAMIARTIANYACYPIALQVFSLGAGAHWVATVIRMPFTLLFYGMLLWLVQSTAAAVRSAAVRPSGEAPEASASTSTPTEDTSAVGYRNMLLGGLWAFGGITITVVTYVNASGLGGRFAVAYGAIFFGIVQFVRGLTQLGGRR